MKRALVSTAFALIITAPAAAQNFALTNARIHPINGPVIERGTVLVRDGRIAGIGASLAVPAGMQAIDASGKTVTPGFFDSNTALGTTEIGLSADGTVDTSSRLDQITAAFNPLDNLNPFSTLIPVTRVEGITRVVVAPSSGASFIAGQGIVIDLGTLGSSITVHRNPVAMYAALGEGGAESIGGARAVNLLRLREVLQDARDYAANRAAFESGSRRDYAVSRLDLEAMIPVVNGQLPLAVQANRASDILSALRLARELNLRLIIQGGAEAWLVARDIAQANVPVIINPLTNIPTFESLGITFENAARLHNAGVTVAFATFDSHNSRNLKQFAGNAVSHGMPHEAALRAVTLTPAQIFGIADRYGSIESGKDADLVVWSGDPFELTTTVERVYIRGVEMPKDTRQRALLERYRRIDW